jgi:hypothetical protein
MKSICPICLKRMFFFYKKTDCGHKFHESCLKKWKLKSNKCPTCCSELFDYYARYHKNVDVQLDIRYKGNSVLIKNINNKEEKIVIKYRDIPYIQIAGQLLIITEVIRDDNNRKREKVISTPYAMEIFDQLTQVFYEAYLKKQNINPSYNFDIDNNLKQIKVYNIEEKYDFVPVKTIKIN